MAWSEETARINFSSFGVDFRSFSYYEYWKIVSFVWLVLGSVVGLESKIDPKKRICYFVFLWFDPIPSCYLRFVFFDGKLNTWSSVRRGTRTSEIRINEPLSSLVWPLLISNHLVVASMGWGPKCWEGLGCGGHISHLIAVICSAARDSFSTVPRIDCGARMTTKVHSLSWCGILQKSAAAKPSSIIL